MDVRVDADPMGGGYEVRARLSDIEVAMRRPEVWREAMHLIAEKLAERFLADHAQEILAQLDPQAVANLAVAAAGAGVREALEKSIPREVEHHYHDQSPVILQRGIFGGVRRVR